LLGVEASLARVSQSGLKTGGGVTTGGARGTITEVALEASWSWTGRCDELRRTLLPLLCRFSSIRPQGRSSHFSLLLVPIYRTLEGWDTLPLPIYIF
jgi:hypothetical protein